jgi:hypothetical protein
MKSSGPAGSDVRCPICGTGTLADIDFDGDDRFQDPESRQVDTFTCGHEVARAPLDVADSDRLDVEQRTSEETSGPSPVEEAESEAKAKDKDKDDQGRP